MSAEEVLLSRAKELGAVSAGIIEARRPNGLDRFYRWLDDGCNADMTYLSARREAYADANAVLPGVRSMVVLAMPQEMESLAKSAFPSLEDETGEASGAVRGRIAFYAVSEDYHSRIRRTLKQLAQTHRELFPNGKCRGVVDTAPILEKDAALTAGLGYIGKNTLLQCGDWGSRVNLAVLLSTESLKPTPGQGGRFVSCGDCRKCIDACPTGALSESGLDARRCLSYWLIEHRGPIPDDIARCVGNRVFGCDVCQDVCPHNRPVKPVYINIKDIPEMTEDEFQTRFGNTPVSRCGLEGLKRNAEIILKGVQKRTQHNSENIK